MSTLMQTNPGLLTYRGPLGLFNLMIFCRNKTESKPLMVETILAHVHKKNEKQASVSSETQAACYMWARDVGWLFAF